MLHELSKGELNALVVFIGERGVQREVINGVADNPPAVRKRRWIIAPGLDDRLAFGGIVMIDDAVIHKEALPVAR